MKPTTYRLGVGLVIVNQQKKIFVGKRNQLTSNLHNRPLAELTDNSPSFLAKLPEKVALSTRYNHISKKMWQMPQGGIEPGESPEVAAFREMQEEIGTTNGHIVASAASLFAYDFPSHIQKQVFNGLYKGQLQRWFLIEFVGDDRQIQVDKGSLEFVAWKWVDIDQVVDLAIDFKKELYKQIIKEFDWHFK